MTRKLSTLLRLFGALAGLLGSPRPAQAEAVQRINFQGRLISPSTKMPVDGGVDIRFRICDHETASCAGGAKLWEEPSGGPRVVSVSNGVFEIELGDQVPISSAVFSGGARFLEVEVDGTPLTPRQRLVSVPTALRAAVADSVEPGSMNYIQLAETLQSGATFYVSSGTVAKDLLVGQNARVMGSLVLEGTLTAGSGANQLTNAAGLLDASKLDAATLVPNASVDPSSVVKLNAAKFVPNSLVDPSSVAKLSGGWVPSYLLDPSSVAKLSGGWVPSYLLDPSSVAKLGAGGWVPSYLLDPSSVAKLGAGGLVPNANLDASSVTKQGNVFNQAGRLARLDASANLALPYGVTAGTAALSGSLTASSGAFTYGVNAATLTLTNLASDPAAPANGMMAYNSSTQRFRCYEDGAWRDCISHSVPVSLGGYNALPNVRTTFDGGTGYMTRGLGNAYVDFTGCTSIVFYVSTRGVGTGPWEWQLWNETDSVQIGLLTTTTVGYETQSTTISAGLPTGLKTIRVRARSTSTAGDDPVYLGGNILVNY